MQHYCPQCHKLITGERGQTYCNIKCKQNAAYRRKQEMTEEVKMFNKKKRLIKEIDLLRKQQGMIASGTTTPMPCNETDIIKLREAVYRK